MVASTLLTIIVYTRDYESDNGTKVLTVAITDCFARVVKITVYAYPKPQLSKLFFRRCTKRFGTIQQLEVK